MRALGKLGGCIKAMTINQISVRLNGNRGANYLPDQKTREQPLEQPVAARVADLPYLRDKLVSDPSDRMLVLLGEQMHVSSSQQEVCTACSSVLDVNLSESAHCRLATGRPGKLLLDLLQQAMFEPDQELVEQIVFASYQLVQRPLGYSSRFSDLSQAHRLK